ncbi:hypothetical protein ACFV80_14185 [Streptomyces sp. NPDC059862]|uniref:hypothetical protein n=1 Tax=Streptomyces sp. NPDC059862 TaxID=3346975 RepID=UPI003646AD8D
MTRKPAARPYGPPGLGLRLAGLCDEGEQRFFDRGLERARAPRRGIFVCVTDLEDEPLGTKKGFSKTIRGPAAARRRRS